MTGRSAWCSPAPGTRHSNAQHEMCQTRLNDDPEKTCACPEHGESSTAERDSRSLTVESETKRGPDRANESDPLVTISTKPKGT